MTREDEIAAKSKRSSTLKSLKLKKMLRLQQLKDEYQTKVREVNIQYAEDPERLKAKYAADDYAKNQPEIIANWKELEKFADKPIKEFSVELYKKIYLFTTLIQTSITNMEEEEE